ncbi:uncharacterized protein VTP21DRAFT_9583 [Calcarisporiella thermophila]|uniref:uncharacterized protein n=1 Tax=Calcarisporiella thermophila TaxID=911321 RepID=UPI003742A77C
MSGSEIPNPFTEFSAYNEGLFTALKEAASIANTIPFSEDLQFYRTLDRSFGRALDTCGTQALSLVNKLLSGITREFDPLEDTDDAVDRFGEVVDAMDQLYERVDVCIDELVGNKGKATPVMTQTAVVTQVASKKNLDYKLIHAQNIIRPQLKFKDKIDNSASTPFIPKITYKPNAKVPLDTSTYPTADMSIKDMPRVPHPYEYELKHIEYPPTLFEALPEQIYTPFDESSFTWVDSLEGLKEMCSKLESSREIAVDLEHHNYRSFQGITCLMQISTRDEDFIVDTLELREHLHLLNQSFTDPSIIKVFHGADHDVLWLQRDFGVYIVGLFDTHQASKVLEYPSHSLAYLLKHFCDVEVDKTFQLADWRIRPLPEEMLRYARSDTHYLLYVFDRLRNELIQHSNAELNLLHATLQRSRDTSSKCYEKDQYDPEGDGPGGWRYLLQRWNRALDARQLAVFKVLHAWRDQTARDEDESLRYVLPNHMLFTLMEKMPTDQAKVIGCCTPTPPLVRMYAHDIALAILRAKESAPQASEPMNIPQPTHVRFDESNEVQDASENEDAEMDIHENNGPQVVATALSVMFDEEETAVADVSSLIAHKSVMFGDEDLEEKVNSEEEHWRKLAEEIRATLVLTLPIPVGSKATLKTSEPLDEISSAGVAEEHLYTRQEDRETKKVKRSDVLVISSMNKKRKSENDSAGAPADEAQSAIESYEVYNAPQAATDLKELEDPLEVIQLPGDADDDTLVTSAPGTKKKRKNRKRKKGSDEAAAENPEGGEANVAKKKKKKNKEKGMDDNGEEKKEFKPHDYSQADSFLASLELDGEGPREQPDVFKKNKKRVDPYGNVEVAPELKRKDPRLPTASKSGSRSMTFKK